MSAKVSAFQPTGTPFDGTDTTRKMERVYFQVTPAGNYAALGDTLDFTGLGDLVKSEYAPVFCQIQSQNPAGNSGYLYSYQPDSTRSLSLGKFQVQQCAGAGSPAADIGAEAYPAAVLADTIIGYADFLRV